MNNSGGGSGGTNHPNDRQRQQHLQQFQQFQRRQQFLQQQQQQQQQQQHNPSVSGTSTLRFRINATSNRNNSSNNANGGYINNNNHNSNSSSNVNSELYFSNNLNNSNNVNVTHQSVNVSNSNPTASHTANNANDNTLGTGTGAGTGTDTSAASNSTQNPNPDILQAEAAQAAQQQQSQQLRRIQIFIPPPQPLPQINVTLNELSEQPLLPQQMDKNDNDDDNSATSASCTIIPSFPSEFECSICYEIMTDPMSCGNSSCDARFCATCIDKQLNNSNNDNDNNNNSNNNIKDDATKKCPCCRNDISSSIVQKDETLHSKIHNSTQRKYCIYRPYGCNVICTPRTVTLHEQTCFNQPFKCKYSSYGCTFQHNKQNLQLHYRGGGKVKGMNRKGSYGTSYGSKGGGNNGGEDHIPECTYAKFHPIIQEQRIQNIKSQHFRNILQSKFLQERSILMGTMHQSLSIQCKTLYNGLDLASCIYVCTCHTVNFVWKSLIWKAFWNCTTTRCIMHNFVSLVPIVVWIVRIGALGLGDVWDFIGKLDERIAGLGDNASDGEIDSDGDGGGGHVTVNDLLWVTSTFVLCLFTVILGIVFLFCFHVDSKSPRSWIKVPFKAKIGRFEINTQISIVQYLQIVNSILIHYLCIDLENHELKARYNIHGMIKVFIILLTSFFPPVIDSILLLTSNLQREQPQSIDYESLKRKLVYGRAGRIIHVGLKYGFIMTHVGPLEMLYGICIYNFFLDCMSSILTSPIELFHDPRDDLLNISKVGRFRNINGTSDTAGGDNTNSDGPTSNNDTDHKLLNYFLYILISIGFVISHVSIYFGTESTEELLDKCCDQIWIPSWISFLMITGFQILSKQIEAFGVRLGLIITKRMIESQGKQWNRGIVGVSSFGLWIFLIASTAFLK